MLHGKDSCTAAKARRRVRAVIPGNESWARMSHAESWTGGAIKISKIAIQTIRI
jgi:hypothetical protein